MVLPILLYCCEIWGYESIHIDFMRHIIPAKKSTSLFMIYGELVRMPLVFFITYFSINKGTNKPCERKTEKYFCNSDISSSLKKKLN